MALRRLPIFERWSPPDANGERRLLGYTVKIRKTGMPTTQRQYDDYGDAEGFALATLAAMKQKTGPFDDSKQIYPTVGQALTTYKESDAAKAKKSHAGEVATISRLQKDEIWSLRADAVTTQTAAQFRDRRMSRPGPSGRKISGNTVRLEMALLSRLWVLLREQGFRLHSNPWQEADKPALPRGRERRFEEVGDGLTERDFLMFTAERSRATWLPRFCTVQLETGMRRSETLSVTPAMIDYNRRIIKLADTKNGKGRTIPLSLKAVAALRPQQDEMLKDQKRLFEIDPHVLNRTFQRAVRSAGLGGEDGGDPDRITVHTMRHEFVSRLVDAGWDYMRIMSISGHLSAQMVKRYSHTDTSRYATALDEI